MHGQSLALVKRMFYEQQDLRSSIVSPSGNRPIEACDADWFLQTITRVKNTSVLFVRNVEWSIHDSIGGANMGCPGKMISWYKLKIANFISGELLQKAQDVNAAKEHMQRTINSLEGSGGANFKVGGDVGNPCHGMPGDGIIKDLGDAETTKIFGAEATNTAQKMAQLARDAAVQGIANPRVTLDEIKRSARAVSSLLQAAIEALGP